MDERVLAVQRMQDYIAENYTNDISLADLSRVSLFSPWHSHRLFTAYTGFTPADYIRRMRLSESARKLKKGEVCVTDAAFEMGFSSVDGFQRAFYRCFGCNPGEYSKSHAPITLFIPYGVKFRELRKESVTMENLQSVFIQVIRKPNRKVIIKRGIKADDYFSYCEEVGCDVWGVLSGMDSLCGEPVCLWLPQSYVKPGTSVYVQGVEAPVDYNGIIPEGFDIIELPEADYLMFQGEPFAEENYCEAIEALKASIDKYEPSVIGYQWDDKNPRIQLEPRGERGYIELMPVKEK